MIVHQSIKQMSQIEHVLARPSMYVGSIVKEPAEEFTLCGDKFKIQKREYIPALIKIFNELIDNSIDEYIRTSGKYANKIQVKITKDSFFIKDNGRGIPNTKMKTLQGLEKYQAETAFTEMLSGSNYDNSDEATIGTNGLGAKASSIFSKKSIIWNADGKKAIKIITKNNLSDVEVVSINSEMQGIEATIYPDLEYFGITEIDEIHQNVIRERLLHLSIAYPDITFKYNARVIRFSPKSYFGMFGIGETMAINKNVIISVSTSDSDSFEHFSVVNGLITKNGGNHIKLITEMIVNPIRNKLIKKFKSIKPGDIRNKLRIVVTFKDFKNARFTSQTKEEITNSFKEITDYLGETPGLDKLIRNILKNENLILPITEYFTLKEQAKQNAELKKLKKQKKRIKSEKYLGAVKNKKVLLLCEGASAVGGLMPALGRDDFGYFELRGVPLNAYDSPQAKMLQNKELSELLQVIQNEDYDYVCTATDADADGAHISGLLLGFMQKYLPEYIKNGRFGKLNTPVQIAIKNKKPQHWSYDLGGEFTLKKGEVGKYMKGLGSFKAELLREIVQQDGIENMIKLFELDDSNVLNDWLSGDRADARKEYIANNKFDITGI